jgi:hypothetical protein
MELIFERADANVETKGDSSSDQQQFFVQSATRLKKSDYERRGRECQTRHSQVKRYDLITYEDTMLEN